MRICLLIDGLGAGGAEGQAVLSACELTARGEEVDLVRYLPDNEHEAELHSSKVNLVLVPGAVLPFGQRIRSIAQFLRTAKPDVVHAFGGGTSVFAQLATQLTGHRCLFGGFRGQSKLPVVYRMVSRVLASRAVGWIVNSTSVRSSLLKQLHVPSEKIFIVPNGLDPQRVVSSLTSDQAKQKFGITPGRLVVSLVANLRPVKNITMFVRMAERAAAEGVNADFLIAGEGPERQGLEREIEARGLSQRVRLLGRCNAIADLLRASEVVALTSHSEGLPNALIEAAASGLPCVSSDNGGAADVIVHGETGYIVPRDDDAAMSSHVVELCRNATLRQAMGRRAKAIALSRFTPAAVADNLLTIYRRGLARKTS